MPNSKPCTWTDTERCTEPAKHPRHNGAAILANLCHGHNKLLEVAIKGHDITAMLEAWSKACGGAEAMSRRFTGRK